MEPLEPTPKRGDVIFVLSRSKEAGLSGRVQRILIDRPWGRRFSHVALVVDRGRMVVEASPSPVHSEETWSGVALSEGVRLRPIPDLLHQTRSMVILRSTSIKALDAGILDLGDPNLASVFGSGYSLSGIKDATARSRMLGHVVPSDRLPSAPPDRIAQMLRDAPEARIKFEKHLRAGQAASPANDYFCSQLVARLLWRAGLLGEPQEIITPCGLFDHLKRRGWGDVTRIDYSKTALRAWYQGDRLEWQRAYNTDVTFVRYIRSQEFELAGLGAACEQAEQDLDAANRLGEQVDRLNKTLQEMNRKRVSRLQPQGKRRPPADHM
jgi:hypothetical protein